MSKQKIIKNLKDKHPKLNESELNKIYEIFCNSIQSALVDNVPKKNKVKFKPSRKLKQFINE